MALRPHQAVEAPWQFTYILTVLKSLGCPGLQKHFHFRVPRGELFHFPLCHLVIRMPFKKKWLPLFLMMAPGLVYLFINNYLPMAGLVVAFKNYNVVDGIFLSPWVGLKNFEYLLKDAFAITRNTLLYNLVFITLNTILGIIFAIFICDVRNKKLRGRNRHTRRTSSNR